MARTFKRLDESRIIELAAQGWNAERVAEEIGENKRTIARRFLTLAPQIRDLRLRKLAAAEVALAGEGETIDSDTVTTPEISRELGPTPEQSENLPQVEVNAPSSDPPALEKAPVTSVPAQVRAQDVAAVEASALDTMSQCDYWLRIAQKQAKVAEANGDLEGLAKCVRLAHQLLDQKRKLAPPPKEDPDTHPDMIAAAQRARERLHKLIDTAVLAGVTKKDV